MRTPAPAWANEEGVESVSRYGGLWWLNTTGNWGAPADAYYAAGAGGQTTLVIPSRDIVIARLTDYEPGGNTWEQASSGPTRPSGACWTP